MRLHLSSCPLNTDLRTLRGRSSGGSRDLTRIACCAELVAGGLSASQHTKYNELTLTTHGMCIKITELHRQLSVGPFSSRSSMWISKMTSKPTRANQQHQQPATTTLGLETHEVYAAVQIALVHFPFSLSRHRRSASRRRDTSPKITTALRLVCYIDAIRCDFMTYKFILHIALPQPHLSDDEFTRQQRRRS